MKKRSQPKQSVLSSRKGEPCDSKLPRPLSVGEYVSCTLLPDTQVEPVIAEVVALDDKYVKAAQEYTSSLETSTDGDFHKIGSSTVDLTGFASVTAGAGSKQQASSSKSPPKSRVENESTKSAEPFLSLQKFGEKCNDYATPPVSTSTSEAPSSHRNQTILPENPICVGRVYVHFPRHDHRLDRWVDAAQLQRASPPAPNQEQTDEILPRKMTRAMKRAHDEVNPSVDADIALDRRTAAEVAAHANHPTIVRNISTLVLGDYSIDAWYYSRMPEMYQKCDTLFVCGTCLQHEVSEWHYMEHRSRCNQKWPPGNLIYEDLENRVRVFEVDPLLNDLYCMRLTRISKLFLEHKIICYDVGAFYFYVVTLDQELAGYFSKEKPLTQSLYNIACLLTFPQHQRKGIGRFIIDLSYELTRREGKVGSPERPLSDLGQVSYRKHWKYSIVTYLRENHAGSSSVSLQDVTQATGICDKDLIDTLKSLGMTHIFKGEYFADASIKLLDDAAKTISEPPIPVQGHLLRGFAGKFNPVSESWPTLPRESGACPANQHPSSARVERPVGSTGKKKAASAQSKTTYTGKQKRTRKKQSKGSTSSKIKLSDMQPEKREHLRGNMEFNDQQLARIDSFIELHSAEACARNDGEEGGLSFTTWKRFAFSINMPFGKVQSKVRQMAQRICARGARIYRVDALENSLPTISTGQRNKDKQMRSNDKYELNVNLASGNETFESFDGEGADANMNTEEIARNLEGELEDTRETVDPLNAHRAHESFELDDDDDFVEGTTALYGYNVGDRDMTRYTGPLIDDSDSGEVRRVLRAPSGRVEFVEAKLDRQEHNECGNPGDRSDIVVID